MRSPLAETGGNRGPAGLEEGDEHRFGLIQPMEARHAPQQRHVLAREPEIAAADAAVAQKRRQHGRHGADRNRKAEPLTAGDDRRVDGDDRSGARDEGTA